MGGKQKQAHRTKNNARPSSSGRTAELLGNSTGKLFSALIENASFNVSTNNQEIDSSINQEFQLTIKKMNKKDPITRQKGLQEFAELCRISDTALVKAVLPFWPKLYNSFATDVDYRVREAAQQAHHAIALAVKRDIAPYLKQLMGTWFVSSFDAHNASANISKLSFQSAFSPPKRTEAIVFAQKEILNYITQNIINETPETVLNSKNIPADEVQLRYQKIVSTNLLGYAHYLAKLPKDQLLNAKEDNKQLILNTSKFWKFAKDDSKTIKASWFTAVLELIDKAPCFLEDSHKKLCVAVFQNLDGSDSYVLPLVWETAIHTCSLVPNWWVHVSPEKLVYPKLWRVLQAGGFGYASVIYPLILPLISKLQVPNVTDLNDFSSKLLSKLISGISIVKVQRIASEIEAIVNAFYECLRYLVKTNLENEELCISLINDSLVSLLKDVLNNYSYYEVSSTVFIHLSQLLHYWSKLRCNSSVFQELIDTTFCSIRVLVSDSITGNINSKETTAPGELDEVFNLGKKLEVHQRIIAALKNPGEIRHKKQTNMKLNCIDEEKSSESDEDHVLATDDYYNGQLRNIINSLIRVYFDLSLKSENSFVYVNQLCHILNLFSDKQYYKLLTDVVIELSDTKDIEKSLIINNLIREWLSDDRISVDAVLNVVFHLLVYLKDEEKVSILNNISEDHMHCMLDLCLNLANDSQLQSSVEKWLSSSYFRSTLSSFAYEVSKHSPPSMEKVNVLKTCFKAPKSGKNYTNSEAKLEILQVFRTLLLNNGVSTNSSPQQLHKDNLSSIAHVLIEVFQEHNYPFLRNYHVVVTSTIGYLFLYGCDIDNHIEKDDILNEAWVLGVKTLATIFGCTSPVFINITEQFAYAVIELVEKSKCSVEDMKHIINFVHTYIECLPIEIEVRNSLESEDVMKKNFNNDELSVPATVYANITSLICEVFLKIAIQYCRTNMEFNIVDACLKSEYYHGSITYRFSTSQRDSTEDTIFNDRNKITTDVNKCFSSIARLFNVAYYISTVIHDYVFVSSKNVEKEAADVENVVVTKYNKVHRPYLSRNGLEKLNEGIVYVVYLLAVFQSFHRNFRQARYHDQISLNDLKKLQSAISDIIKSHHRSPIVLLKLSIMDKAFKCGGFWAEALFLLFTELMDTKNLNEAHQEIVKCFEESNYDNKSFLLQISELFATVAQLRVEKFSPDAKLDEEKLSILTCYLRANKDNKFTSDQDRVIWYWLDTILIQKKQLEVTFNKNLTDCKVSDVMLAAIVCRFLSVVSDGTIPLMTDKRTDFMMIALASWMQSVHKTCSNPIQEENQFSMPVCVFVSAVCDMFQSMTKLASHAEYSDKLFIEWNNVFASETNTIISFNWKCLAENDGCRKIEQFLMLNTLSNLIMTDVKFIPFVVRPALNFWMCTCSDLIQHYCTPVRLAAYTILEELSLEMVNQDSCASVVEDMDEKLTLEILSISSLQTIVNIVLSSYKNDENRTLDPNTDSYVYVHSYLLVWMVVIRLCENAPAKVRYRYASWLKDEGYLEIFLNNLLSLMPDKLRNNNLSDSTIKKFREYFSNKMKFIPEDHWDIQKLNLLVCRLYYMTLWLLPSFVRQWWKSLDHKDAVVVDKVTTKFFSPSLILEEMKAIKREKPLENFSMRGYPANRQIVASYTVEDTNMEITMELAVNHPLGIVKVDSSKVGVLSSKWKTWAKQLNMFLTHQNGLIRDGIMSWKSNVDKAFEGVEECYICFSVVHSSNYELPKKSCKACHKKFHPLCLYRWFVTSNKSTCPICRNHF